MIKLESLTEENRLCDIVDQDGFTLLHMAVFKNKTKIVEAIIKKAKQDMYQYEVAEWVN